MKRSGGEWGGDVVGFSRCPGEQDPKRWGFKVDEPHRHASDRRKHVCTGSGSRSYAVATRSKSRDTRHRRSKSRDRSRRRGGRDECDAHHSRRGRQRTLIFRESEDYPRREQQVPAYRHVTPTRYGPSRSGGRHREGRQMRDGDHRRGPMMRGALGDDDERRYYERRPQYSRAGSYERRSDQDELVGEIDDQTEDSYAIGEHQKMVVSRRDDHGYRRGVRFK
ncbi:hypothetical protein GQ607_014689 [Colletotrichum asianum]|uniref:Uncharacterized protein n=1 Tax=Colletotrichum asianum TaxID=702518 RepID=A0A8H3VZ12_9PEZI|nr:hypothetical protein GQ607_014689 [Colletotrichum asianum]